MNLMMWSKWWRGGLVAALCALLAACGSLGPKTIRHDQVDYGFSIADSWKDQLLANVVRLRYQDMPVFVDVGQIVNGYSLETTIDSSWSWQPPGDNFLGASGSYTDRPTITYVPKIGEDFLSSMLEPIDPVVLLSLIAVGYNPELLLTWGVESINGVRNYSAAQRVVRLADPKFREFTRLLTELQQSSSIGFEVRSDADAGRRVIFFFDDDNISDEIRAKHRQARDIIGLDASHEIYHVRYSPFRLSDNVLAIQTRSILQILTGMSRLLDVPSDKEARATPGIPMRRSRPPFSVRVTDDPPEDAYASVKYGGDWYWIDQEDLESKRVFNLMLFLTTLTGRRGQDTAPVLTIPTG